MGLCAAAFLTTFTLGMCEPSTIAAIANMVSGAVVWFLWTAFVHTAEAKQPGLCQAIFGKPALLSHPWSVIDPPVIALPVSLVGMLVHQKHYGDAKAPEAPAPAG